MRDAELQLVIDACRVSIDRRPVEEPSANICWPRVAALADRHRVQGQCWNGLKPLAGYMPSDVSAALRDKARAIVAFNLRTVSECARLHELSQTAGLALLFLKGLTLGSLAYRDPFLKMSLDIDLLIEPDRLAGASNLLRSAGYIPTIPRDADGASLNRWHATRKESVWCRDDFQVDLHTRPVDHPSLLPEIGATAPAQAVSISPAIQLPTLAPDELFAYLCVHGASSAWFRLKWITDLAALLSCKPAEEIDRLYRRSQELGAGRAAAQALLLAHQIHEIEIGPALNEQLTKDPVNRWLLAIAKRELSNSDEPSERFLGTAWIHGSQFALLPSWSFKLSEAVRQVQYAMQGATG